MKLGVHVWERGEYLNPKAKEDGMKQNIIR